MEEQRKGEKPNNTHGSDVVQPETAILFNVVSTSSLGYADEEDRFQQITKMYKKKDLELAKARELINVLNKSIGNLMATNLNLNK